MNYVYSLKISGFEALLPSLSCFIVNGAAKALPDRKPFALIACR